MESNKDVLHPMGPRPAGTMRRLLICLDRSPESETCLSVAVALARSFGSELQLLHVLGHDASAGDATPPDPASWQIARTEAEQYLAQVAARLSELGLHTRTAVLEGNVAEQILCCADREDFDLIVLASHGEKGVSEWALGSTAEKVLARARSSVLVVPVERPAGQPASEAPLERILVPLDGSPQAESLLPQLGRLAREGGATLILLHVATPLQLFESRSSSSESADVLRRLEAYNEREARRYLGRIRERLSREGCTARELFERGDPRSILPSVASRERVDLIAITSHGRTGDRSCSYGDTAAHLLRSAPVPVLMFQNLPQRRSEFASAVRHRREISPLRGNLPPASP